MADRDLCRAEILRCAGLVRRGEWTTYGDISMAATGSRRAARLVGRLAADDEGFPNAQRVLRSNGSVSRPDSGWVERARRALEAEGVSFVCGRADPGKRVHWDELARRAGRRARR